ncbi:MAG: hypothetical protein ACR2Q4_17220 [Geminicoccaceae bacterium]
MSSERYVGERRALWHFLSELQPLVVAILGDDALLRHRIDQALTIGDLDSLRNARRIFHNQPEDLKRRLMRGIFEGSNYKPDPEATDPKPALASDSRSDMVVRFDAMPAALDEDVALSVEAEFDQPRPLPIQILIKTGTLPRSAAVALRQVADWIEYDRRLLSSQHWAREDKHVGQSDETVDQA